MQDHIRRLAPFLSYHLMPQGRKTFGSRRVWTRVSTHHKLCSFQPSPLWESYHWNWTPIGGRPLWPSHPETGPVTAASASAASVRKNHQPKTNDRKKTKNLSRRNLRKSFERTTTNGLFSLFLLTNQTDLTGRTTKIRSVFTFSSWNWALIVTWWYFTNLEIAFHSNFKSFH